MLRGLVGLLLVANLAFFAWSQGWLDDVVGVRAGGEHEPERIANQVNPDRIVILSAPSGVAPVVGVSCLEVGAFDPAEVVAAEAALQGLAPAGSWTNVRTEKPGIWMVYMGSYPDQEAMRRKEEEIGRGRAELEEVALPSEGAFGLSLGRFDDRAGAERALAQHQLHGIRTARVVQASAPAVSHTLRIERAGPALAAQLTSKADVLGKGFAACARPEGAPR